MGKAAARVLTADPLCHLLHCPVSQPKDNLIEFHKNIFLFSSRQNCYFFSFVALESKLLLLKKVLYLDFLECFLLEL